MSRTPDLKAEHERLSAEFQSLLSEVEVAEAAAERERGRLAAARALGELSDDATRVRRGEIRAALNAKREGLSVLKDVLREIVRREAEAEQERRARERQKAERELRNAVAGRETAGKALARALRSVAGAVAERGATLELR